MCFILIHNFVLDPYQFSTIELCINQTSLWTPEAAMCACVTLWKKLVLNILQYLQKNTCVGVSLLYNIYKIISVLESLSKDVADQKASSFILQRLQHRCFLVNIAKFLRTPILKNICKWLLLESYCITKPHFTFFAQKLIFYLYKKIVLH